MMRRKSLLAVVAVVLIGAGAAAAASQSSQPSPAPAVDTTAPAVADSVHAGFATNAAPPALTSTAKDATSRELQGKSDDHAIANHDDAQQGNVVEQAANHDEGQQGNVQKQADNQDDGEQDDADDGPSSNQDNGEQGGGGD